MTEIILPKTFRQKDIDYLTQGKGNPDLNKYIGKPKISYSDLNLFLNETYSKNSLRDYVLQQFLKVPSSIPEAYGEFGKATEDYICKKENTWGFSDEERQVLDTIKPLGEFQQGFVIDFDDFVLIGLKDDVCEVCDTRLIRDYKTASESSYEKQYKEAESNMQLKIYALSWYLNKHIIPDKLQLVVVERFGNPFAKEESDRKLRVGKNVWIKEFITNEKELLELKDEIVKNVRLISSYYQVFTKLNI